MKWENHYLCVFESKNHAILLYTLLEAGGKNVFQLVSTPCGLKAGCTYSIKIPNKSYISLIKKEIEAVNLKEPRIFYVDKIEGKTVYKEVGFI